MTDLLTYTELGCYATNATTAAASLPSASLSNCFVVCLKQKLNFVGINQVYCSCFNEPTGVKVSSSLCDTNCIDSDSKCGGKLAFSLYNYNSTQLPAANTINQQENLFSQTWVICLLVAGAVLIIGLIALIIYCTIKRNKTTTLSRFPQTSKEMLIPGLPKTGNMTYMATSTYFPIEINDEIIIHKNDIVHVTRTYSDGFAKGDNISTGKHGVFPLSAFVDGGQKVEERLESLEG